MLGKKDASQNKKETIQNKPTKKNYRFLAYLDEEQYSRVKHYLVDNFGKGNELDAGMARSVLMQLLTKTGY